jgi:hypothetical protein
MQFNACAVVEVDAGSSFYFATGLHEFCTPCTFSREGLAKRSLRQRVGRLITRSRLFVRRPYLPRRPAVRWARGVRAEKRNRVSAAHEVWTGRRRSPSSRSLATNLASSFTSDGASAGRLPFDHGAATGLQHARCSASCRGGMPPTASRNRTSSFVKGYGRLAPPAT